MSKLHVHGTARILAKVTRRRVEWWLTNDNRMLGARDCDTAAEARAASLDPEKARKYLIVS